MARVSKLSRHVTICHRGNILKSFLMKMEEFSLMTKTLFCCRIIKECSLFFVGVFYVYSSEKTISSVTTQHFNNHAKNTHTKETKKLPVSCQSAMGQAKIFPSIINACILCIQNLCKTLLRKIVLRD